MEVHGEICEVPGGGLWLSAGSCSQTMAFPQLFSVWDGPGKIPIQWTGTSVFRGRYAGCAVPEGIFDQKLRNQRIRSRSWEWQGGKSKRKAEKLYRNQEKNGSWKRSGVKCRNNTLGVMLDSQTGVKSWREVKSKKIILQTMWESLAPTVG